MFQSDSRHWLNDRVVVVSDGNLGEAIQRTLNERGLGNCISMTPADTSHLAKAIADASLVICALGQPEWMLAVNDAACAASVVATFVRGVDEQIVVGPTVIPHRSPCFRCLVEGTRRPPEAAGARLSPPSTGRRSDDSLEARARYAVAALVLWEEVEGALSPGGNPACIAGTLTITRTALRVHEALARSERCRTCAGPASSAKESQNTHLEEYGQLETALGTLRAYQDGMSRVDRSSYTEFKTVGIIGGGTAGYLAALTLRTLRPDLQVTLIESSSIPVIGVGEATIDWIVPFLHHVLGLDILELHEAVRPTFKLGIRFEWGMPGDYHFNFPFEPGRTMETQVQRGSIREVSLGSVLMDAMKAPIAACAGQPYSLLGAVPYAYHLDNKPFVSYLSSQARRSGVIHLDREIVDAVVVDGPAIDSLIDKDGVHHRFDLFVDCSGFRSLLLEQKLGSRFISFDTSLFTDRAVVASVPNDGNVKPYTTAETMDSGWCWNIPMMDEDHRGYVFASAFCTPEQAVAEMRAKNPRMKDEPWLVKFRSGRHEHFFKGNVVAIGNSYGFVEPLESTAIHVIIQESLWLAKLMPRGPRDDAGKDLLNRLACKYWDDLRWFLSLHYKFNRRIDSPFWRECWQHADVSGARGYLDLFRQGGPLASRGDAAMRKHLGVDPFGIDVLLVGQGVHENARLVPPLETSEEVGRRSAAFSLLADRSLPHRAALELLVARPELLYEQLQREDSWVVRNGNRMKL